MNLYLDTSALVKLYVEEQGRPAVTAALSNADIVATATIAYVEARAAFVRRRQEGVLAAVDYRKCVRDLDRDWPRYLRFEVNESLIFTAARMAERYKLRAYDAVHVSAALAMQNQIGDAVFACWDRNLNSAARRAGLNLLS